MKSMHKAQLKGFKKDKEFNKFNQKNMKLKELVGGVESLGVLMGTKLPIVLSFKLSLFVKKVNPEVEEYGKKRDELLKELAEPIKDEKGKETGQMKFKNEKAIKEFNTKIEELLEQDVKVEVPELKISEFAGLEIEPKHLSNLDWLIKM